MNPQSIKTDQDYQAALSRIEDLWGAIKNSPEGDELDHLVTQVESYEMKHYPIPPPNLIDAKK